MEQGMSDQERRRFETHPQFAYLEFDRDTDAWGRGKYRHSHVQALWEGWSARAAVPSQHMEAKPQGDAGQPDECRAAFERNTRRIAIEGKHCPDELLRKKPNGNYAEPSVYSAWGGWRAAWHLRQTEREAAKQQPVVD